MAMANTLTDRYNEVSSKPFVLRLNCKRPVLGNFPKIDRFSSLRIKELPQRSRVRHDSSAAADIAISRGIRLKQNENVRELV